MKMRTGSSTLLLFSHSRLQHYNPLNPTTSFLCLFSSLSSSSPAITTSSNSALVDCLMSTYKLTKIQALSISNRYSWDKSPNKPKSVHEYFRELGFSETQIRSVVLASPQILFSCVNKTLRPKLEYFQQMGVEGSDLGMCISKNPVLLQRSLKNTLVPCISMIKEILGSDQDNKDFIRVLGNCRMVTSSQRLLNNRAFLESYGIVGPRLSWILKRRPYILLMTESKLGDVVSRVLDMGFSRRSCMFLHGLYTVCCLSDKTLKKKLDLLVSFGFSQDECKEMFRKAPVLLRISKEKLKFGIDFFFNIAELKRSCLIRSPWLLMSSMNKRVIPRYKVLQVLKLKRAFKGEPSFSSMLFLTEAEFLEKWVLKFEDDAEELLLVYKDHNLDFNEEEES